MVKAILTNRNLYPSARALRNALQEICGERIVLANEPRPFHTVVVRWGTTAHPLEEEPVVNSIELISTCSNKLRFSDALQNSGLLYPEFKRERPADGDFPILVRRTMSGFGGAGIVPCRNIEEWEPNRGHYWTRYMNINSEFRIHVLGGKIARVFKKVLNDGVAIDEEFKIRNLHRGYRFSLIDHTSKPVMKALVEKLWGHLGFENGMCAFDVGWINGAGYFVIEGNSAPGLSENNTTCLMYAEYIKSLL